MEKVWPKLQFYGYFLMIRLVLKLKHEKWIESEIVIAIQ